MTDKSYRSVRHLLWAGLFYVAACGKQDECFPSGPRVADSAGISLIANCLSFSAPAWQIDTIAPLVSIDRPVLGDSGFVFVTGVLQVQGNLLVADHSGHRLHLFARDGSPIKSFGREGQGPGEFLSSPVLTRFEGDSVAAIDIRARRITIFPPDFESSRSYPLTTDQRFGVVWPIGRGQRQRLLVRRSSTDAPRLWAGALRSSIELIEIGPAGEEYGPFLRLSGIEVSATSGGLDGRAVTLLFGKNTVLASDSHAVYAALNDGFSINEYGHDGVLRRVVKLSAPRVRITTSMQHAYQKELLVMVRNAAGLSIEARKANQKHFMSRPFAEFMPWIQSMFLSRERDLWVVAVLTPGESNRRLYRFSPSGHLSGMIDLPRNWNPVGAWNDSLLTIYKDENQIEKIQVLRTRQLPVTSQ